MDEIRTDRFTWNPGQAEVRGPDGEELHAADTLPLGENPPAVVVTPDVDTEVKKMEAQRRAGELDKEAYGVDR